MSRSLPYTCIYAIVNQETEPRPIFRNKSRTENLPPVPSGTSQARTHPAETPSGISELCCLHTPTLRQQTDPTRVGGFGNRMACAGRVADGDLKRGGTRLVKRASGCVWARRTVCMTGGSR